MELQVIQALLTLKDEAVEAEMIRLQVLPLCLDLFFKYQSLLFAFSLIFQSVWTILSSALGMVISFFW